MSQQRVFLEVRGGPMGFRRATLAPGDRVRVGRTSLSDFVVGADEQLSQVHFEITWDGVTCEVRDVGGAGGISVGGETKGSAAVRSGAWIRAGRTDFTVFFEDMGEVAADAAVTPGAAQALSQLSEAARRRGLYAVLDAAKSERIVPLLHAAADEWDSLYEGLRAETMADGAPYLVALRPESRLLRRLVLEGWGQSWGTYLESPAKLAELRAHFRRILVVTREKDALPMYFRFYDPRVLRGFLPIATARQVEVIFGPVERFFTEAPGGELRVFGRSSPGVLAQVG